MTVRFFMLQGHYTSTLDFSNEALQAAERGYKRMTAAMKLMEKLAPSDTSDENIQAITDACYAAMNDDFNTPIAIAVLFDLASEANKHHSVALSSQLKGLANVIGLLEREPKQFLQAGGAEDGLSDDDVLALIAARAQAKQEKNFSESDRIRADLLSKGIVLEDKPGGLTEWRRA